MGAVTIPRTVVVPASSEIIMPATVSVPKCSQASEPGHALSCTGKYDADQGLNGMVEGDTEFVNKTELCVARLAVTMRNNMVPVRLSNLSDTPITLYQGTKIAEFEALDESVFGDVSDTEAEFCPDRAAAHLEEPVRSQFHSSQPCSLSIERCSPDLVGRT